MTRQILSYVEVGVSLLLIVVVLLQQKGTGLSGAFGGSGGFYRTKRGFERTLFIATIVFAAVFLVVGIANVFLSK